MQTAARAATKPVVEPPRPVYAPPPAYPGLRLFAEARAGVTWAAAVRPEGRLRLRLFVRADGTVGDVEVVTPSGEPELDRAAAEALRRWRFQPARRDGQPVDSYYLVWVVFELQGR
ncbi:MAG: energy transducer TonB [Armatimonadota bacterium]|nr:energy transducer TonB [Armatimonadota bacterium]MDW8156045.1 energy transducer TonB [Armatimonadota bacterium]